jgi:hypothetical protein
MKDLLTKKKKINFEDIDLTFKGLTTQDLFVLLDDYPSFIHWLFIGVSFQDEKEFAKTIFRKYPQILSLILAMTCTDIEDVINKDEKLEDKITLTLEEKIEIFNNCDISYSLEALKAVCDLTFKDGVAATVKKWKVNLDSIVEIFFKTKEEIQTK